MKIEVGAARLVGNIKRIPAVRDTIGPDCRTILDGNGAWTLESTNDAFLEYRPVWFEKPWSEVAPKNWTGS